jgi:hypothetical protein
MNPPRYLVVSWGKLLNPLEYKLDASWIINSLPQDGRSINFVRNRALAWDNADHLIFLDGAIPTPGFFETLRAEYESAVLRYAEPVWLSPRYLPVIQDTTLGMQFAEANGVSTDTHGFVSAPPFSLAVTENGAELRCFMTSFEAFRALAPFDEEYQTSTWANIDLGLKVLLKGHKSLLSWTACVCAHSHIPDPDRESIDHERFRSYWGDEGYKRHETGQIWQDLRKAKR